MAFCLNQMDQAHTMYHKHIHTELDYHLPIQSDPAAYNILPLANLMAALMASLQEILKLSDEQLTAFTADFEARLPEYLRNALHPEIAMA